jgi:predicted AlkP superfamily pyrophosphatase or phosphodiesterase
MRPSFPSVTFPNHYTLVTGLRPDRNGVVGNTMEDPAKPGVVFTMQTTDPFWWNEAEPVWITAERAGVPTATMFWPGSNVDFGGVRPHDWQQYSHDVTDRQRVDGIVDWLRRPVAERPRFLTLYFDAIDSAGHRFGPDDPRTAAEITRIDGEIGRLTDAVARLGVPANYVIVADHGMAAVSADRLIRLDTLLAPDDYRLVFGGAVVGLKPKPGHEARVADILLRPHDHLHCFRKAALPARLHYGKNPRVPAFVCLVDVGWLAIDAPPRDGQTFGGAHGYDPASHDMDALFIATGPAFKAGVRLAPFDNVDVYPLLADLIGVAPRPNDGTDAVFAPALTAPR